MRISNLLAAVSIVITLTGCESLRIITKTETVVVAPPANLYQCPDTAVWPQGEFTQRDVARTATQLYEDREICRESLNAIKRFSDEATKINEQPEPEAKKGWWKFW